ncbi:hypothetical protein EDB83DRAFT_1541740 [Lactarius deliciosus]|nr:hypothetical protein EDB83DRAFT_1541740 [Lactarius deliciosus]
MQARSLRPERGIKYVGAPLHAFSVGPVGSFKVAATVIQTDSTWNSLNLPASNRSWIVRCSSCHITSGSSHLLLHPHRDILRRGRSFTPWAIRRRIDRIIKTANRRLTDKSPRDNRGSPQRERAHEEDAGQPQSLLTRPVLTSGSVANYASLALLNTAAGALMSLLWSTPIVLSGLSLTSAYGCASALPVHVLSTPRRAFWPVARRRLPRYTSFDNVLGAMAGRSSHCSSCRVWSLTRGSVCAVFMFSSSTAPKKLSLGATNDLAQTVVDPARGRLGACGFA